MPAGTWDWTGDHAVEPGASWTRSVNVTGLTTITAARLQVRTKVDVDPPFVDLSLGNGLSVAAGTPQVLTITMTPTQTREFIGKKAVYDLFVTDQDGARVTRLTKGTVEIQQEVTRD